MNRRNVEIVLSALEDLSYSGNERRFAMEAYFQPRGRGEDLGEVETFAGLLTYLGAKRSDIAKPRISCGTVACLAGWTQMVLATERQANLHPFEFAMQAFGLDSGDAAHWFLGSWAVERSDDEYRLEDITLDHTIRFLRHVLATGQARPYCGYLHAKRVAA